MLVNMPTTSIGQTLSNMEPNTAAQGSCVEYNYLKRKLNTEDILSNHQPQQQPTIINENGSSNNGTYPVTLWKKRHLEVLTTPAATTNNFGQILNDHTIQNGNCKNNNNNNNINADNNNDLQFNIMSNAFINDLFSYDNNLIVPVTSTLTDATTVSFTAPSSVSINAANYVADADDGNTWQATDLLELDHRYNSALQPMEEVTTTPTIAQINSTIVVSNHDHQQQQQQNHQQHSTQQQQTNFLVPQSQVSRSQSSNLAKYRQHFQLQQQHAQQPQQEHQNHEYSGHPQQQQQQTDTETDFEDKNLSWLLNFKFDELPHLSPDIGNTTRLQTEKVAATAVATANAAPLETAAKSDLNSPSSNHSSPSERSRSKSPKTSTKASKKFEELVMEVTAECDGSDMIIGENVVVEDYSPKAQKKPPFTYTELIEYALEDKGELTVSGIYQWISDRFPFYKSNDDRWKNSVRHNLSINPHFRKGAKAPQGAGHLWTISSGDSAENVLAWEHKKQRLDLFFKMESMNRERIQEHQQKLQKQQQQLLRQHRQQQCSTLSALHQSCQPDQCQYDEAAAAAAAITQEMLQQTNSSSSGNTSTTTTSCSGGATVRHGFHELPFNDLMSDEELRKTAGQILNGIHREVEVQSVNSIISTYHDVLLDSDYLNPIHKDVAVNESGLRNTCHAHTSQYYITEIDPIELGIQMSHQVEEEVLFSDEFNLNYFGYNAGNDIVA